MTRIELTGPGGQRFFLDTPDPALIGVWIKSMFDSFQVKGNNPVPLDFQLRIS